MVEISKVRNHPVYKEDLNRALNVSGIERLRGKRFLITGATGLIGTFLIDSLMYYNRSGAGISIVATGRDEERAKQRFGCYWSDPLFSFIEHNVLNPFPESLIVDYIIPLASNTHPLAYSKYPVETISINVFGAINSLDLAARCNAIVLYPSSVEIYGNGRGQGAFKESDTGFLNLSNARSCYPESKRLSEALCMSYSDEKGVITKVVRLSRVIGPTMLPNDSKASSQFIKNAVNRENIVLKSSGKQLFSYTYVADVVNAMLAVLLNGDINSAYNISVESCNVSLLEFASICAELSGTSVVFDVPTENESKGYSIASVAIMDNTKLCELPWRGAYSIREALEHIITILRA
jgi:nucleoside-diphosphate-sugar epimerase